MEQLVHLEKIKFLCDELDVNSGKNLKCFNEYHMDENLPKENLPGQKKNLNKMKWHLIQTLRILGGKEYVHHH